MMGQVPTKLRLVRCPKCRRLLPELPNVPVYQCGGCSTVLEAKKQKVASKDATPLVTESVTVHNNELQSISFDKEVNNLSREETLPPKGHHLVATNCDSNQTEIQVCNGEHPMDVESSPEISTNLMHQEEVEKTTDVDEDECLRKDAKPSTRFCEESMHHRNLQSTPERDECITKDTDSSTETLEEHMHHRSLSSTPDVDMDECVSGDVETLSGFPEELVNNGNVVANRDSPDTDKECLSNQIAGDDENKNDLCRDKPHRRVSFSDELIFSTELNHLGNEDDVYETVLELTSGPEQRESLTVLETNIKSNEYYRSRILSGNSPVDGSLDEIVSNHDRPSSPTEELEQYYNRKSFHYRERMSSIDTLDNIVALRDMPESPMTRSYYGLCGSGSSCDETDDQVSDRNFHLNNRNIEDRQLRSSELLGRIGEVSNNIRGNSEVQGQNGYFSSSQSGNRLPPHRGLPRYGNKIETIEHQSRVPLYQHGHRIGYSNGNYSNDELNTNFNLPNKREYLEVEKMELLKKVRELQDELNRTCISEGKQSENFLRPDQNRVHQYPDEFMHNQEFNRYHEGNSGPHQSKFSWNSFSSEATTSRNEVEYVCPQYPNQPISNIPLHSYDAKPDTSKLCSDQNDSIKLRAERLYLGKKHVLPVAGAAPFLLCYGCSEVLQMPADFLLFKRRYHKLKCNSCLTILKFSLLRGNQIVRFMDHSSRGLSQIEPVSVDDHEPFLCKSFSTEESPSSIDPQFDDLKRNFSGKKPSIGEKGNTFSNFIKTLKSIRSSSRKSKAESSSLETEEVPASTTSPLHRLMGYHSASYLLKS